MSFSAGNINTVAEVTGAGLAKNFAMPALRMPNASGKRKTPLTNQRGFNNLVPTEGLEPPHLAAHGPEPCASTNSATWAYRKMSSIADIHWKSIIDCD